jgi:hypothetical protein
MLSISFAARLPDCGRKIWPELTIPSASHRDVVQMAIDYNHLIDQFGTKRIDNELLERFERLTGRKPHLLLRRETFFSHR